LAFLKSLPHQRSPTDNPFTGKRDGKLTTTMSEPAPKRRLKLNYSKCAQCRTAKKKVSTPGGRWFRREMLTLVVGPEQCEPESREWPGQKCDRCEELGLACSANSSVVSAREPGPSASAILQALGPSPPPDEQELVREMWVMPFPLCRCGHSAQSLGTD